MTHDEGLTNTSPKRKRGVLLARVRCMNRMLPCLLIGFWLHALASQASALNDDQTSPIQAAHRLMNQGDISSAITLLTQAIAQHPDDGNLYAARADAHVALATTEAMDAAIADYSKALSVRGDNAEWLRKRAVARRYTSEVDVDAILADFQASLRLDSDNVVTLSHRGEFYLMSGRLDEAEADFQRAHDVDPQHFLPLNNLGYLAGKRGHVELAIKYFSKSISANSSNAAAYANRGYAYHKLQRYDKALIDLNKAIELNATAVHSLLTRGDTRAAMGDYRSAVEDYSRALAASQGIAGHAGAYAKRAAAYVQLGETEKAENDVAQQAFYGDTWEEMAW